MKAVISVADADGMAAIEVTSTEDLERVTQAYDRIELDYSIQYETKETK